MCGPATIMCRIHFSSIYPASDLPFGTIMPVLLPFPLQCMHPARNGGRDGGIEGGRDAGRAAQRETVGEGEEDEMNH